MCLQTVYGCNNHLMKLVILCILVLEVYGHGIKYRRPIVGGDQIDILGVPYIASVQEFGQHVCGGSILSMNYVLSAAHCMDKNVHPSLYKIQVGSSHHNTGGFFYEVKSIRHHEQYNSSNHDYDIALLKTGSNIIFNQKVQPIDIVGQNEETTVGTLCRVSGWGSTKTNNEDDLLRSVVVPIYDQNECQSRFSIITQQMICAGCKEGGKDSCQGDSGGPLVNVKTKQLVGVVSFGIGCAEPNNPGVYASVAALSNWIKRHVGITKRKKKVCS